MGNPQRPRLAEYQGRLLTSAASEDTPTLASSSVPLASPNTFEVVRPFSVPVDFEYQAKVYRRSAIKRRAIRMLIIFGIILALIVAGLGMVGYALNRKYAGRALPYTTIGNVPIGGLTQSEIKAVLEKKASKLEVTFTEGGLVRKAPVSSFGVRFDYDKASRDAITGFNPFSYLVPKAYSIAASVNEREVDGYLRLNVADKQTDPVNAEIIKNKKELVIAPELNGFRTNTKYVVEQMNQQLAELKDPVVNLLGASERPTVTAADLQDDIDDARAIVGLDIGIKVWNTVIKPSQEEKLKWLEFKDVANTGTVSVHVSQAAVREYVFGVAKKYTKDAQDEQLVTNADGTQSVSGGRSGSAVENVDDVAAKLYAAVASRQGGVFDFKIAQSEYKKVDRPVVQASVAQELDTQNQSTPTAESPQIPQQPQSTPAATQP